MTEPNGDTAENCALVIFLGNQSWWFDGDCSVKECSFCFLDKEPLVRLRGKIYHKHKWRGGGRVECTVVLIPPKENICSKK